MGLRLALLAAAALAATGCVSPHARDCKALLPILDDARGALAIHASDGGLAKPRFADRARDVLASLRGVRVRSEALRAPVARLLDATARFEAAMTALDELARALQMSSPADVDPVAIGRTLDDARPHVERLLATCAAPPRGGPVASDCAALTAALERCVSPEAPSTSAEELLLTCARAVDAVESPDPGTRDAVAAVARALRELEPLARLVRAPAGDVLAHARRLSPQISAHAAARLDAEKAASEIRALCAR